VQVDLFEGEINAGDTLLLCSDGLTGRVQDHEIASIVRGCRPDEAARRLIALANDRGGNDNITVLIVQVCDEAVTLKAPLVAPVAVKPGPKLPLAPILGGVVAVVALVLIGAGLWWQFGRGPGATETPTPVVTLTESPVAPTDTVFPTDTVMPTETLVLTETATLTPTVSTETPTSTGTPTLEPTFTHTPTLEPTFTDTPTPTFEATLAPTATGTTGEAAQKPTITPTLTITPAQTTSP
jgi:hypothetical protein